MKHSAVSIRRHFLAGLVFATLTGSTVVAQDDWRNWGRDLGNQRHSPLTEINADNVDQLELAWRYEMPRPGVPSRPAQSTPLMVDGVLYLSFPYYRVVAVVPETGEELWDYTAPGQWDSVEHQQHWTGGSMRGLAYWGGQNGIAPQIVFGTEEGELISLNAATGIPGAHFGNDGYVNLKTEDVMNGFPNMHYGIGSGVAIYKHLVFTPVHNADETGSKGPAGDVRAWDLRTGELVWTFHTVPHPGEFGNDTWLDGSWERVSGANTWSFFTIDEERGILYMPLGSALNDFYGMDRPGDNLFANSIVAVDAMTGERLWHFQAIHHDLWDLDMPVPPILFDVEQDGEVIPAVGVMTKFPVLFIFNRVTGEPVYEIEERPVPAGNMQGEYYSPTQPFPVKPPVFGRIDFTMDDIATVTPEHTAACRERLMAYDGGRNRGAYTPPSLEGALVFPSTGGGTEFTGGTFDPELGYYIINYADTGHISTLEPVGENPDRRGYVGPPESRRRYWHIVDRLSVDGWPCWQPPWSQLVAVDVNSGEIAWKIPFGTVEGAPPGLLTGAPNSQKGGPTSTAAGILFIGGASDRMFRAYETKTGRELWSVETEQMISGSNPIVYMGENGKQYVAVAAGTTLLAYALP
jgi:quinoprotein glucose dehydrogenase